MSCVVGFIDVDGTVYIGSDSAAFITADLSLRSLSKEMPKVFKKENILIGCVGSPRPAQILKSKFFSIPKHEDGDSDIDYIAGDFLKAIVDCFKENECILNTNTTEELSTASEFLVGYRGKLYTIDGGFSVVSESSKYVAIGAGDAYALGALSILDKYKSGNPVEIITETLEIASTYSAVVRPPFTIISLDREYYSHLEKI